MKRFAVLAAGLLALLGTTAAQAGAVEGQASAPTATTCVSDFSSLRTLTARGEKRGHFDQREPELKQGGKKSALDKANGKKGGKGFRVTIPVYVHVVTAGGRGELPNATIEEQIQVLSLAYGGFYGGPGFYPVTDVSQYDVATVETNLYDARTRSLIWAGTTETINPSNVAKEAPGFADLLVTQFRARGLVPPAR